MSNSDTNTNVNIYEIKDAIKKRMDGQQRFIDRYDEKRSEVWSKLHRADIKNEITVAEYEKLLRKEKAYTEHINDEANILFGLETAYGIICEALGEEW